MNNKISIRDMFVTSQKKEIGFALADMFENDINKGMLCFATFSQSKNLQVKEGIEMTKFTIEESKEIFFKDESILCAHQLASVPSQVVLLIYKRAFIIIFDRLTRSVVHQIHCPTNSSAFNAIIPVKRFNPSENQFVDNLRKKEIGGDEFFIKDVRGISYVNCLQKQAFYVAELNYNKYPIKNSIT